MEQLLRLKYCKVKPIKYVSHLNLAQLFTRSLRRADIPVVISEGFNPRFRISFGPPLPLGISSTSEYLDLRLKKDMRPSELIKKLNKVLPKGLKIVAAEIIPISSISLVKAINSASYKITVKLNKKDINLPRENLNEEKQAKLNLDEENIIRERKNFFYNIDKSAKEFLNQPEIKIEKRTKEGTKKINIKPIIINMSINKFYRYILEFSLKLKIGQEINLNPRYVIEAWLSNSDYSFRNIHIIRDGLYIDDREIINS